MESKVKDFTEQLEKQQNKVESLEEAIKTSRKKIKDAEEKYTEAKVRILMLNIVHTYNILVFLRPNMIFSHFHFRKKWKNCRKKWIWHSVN